MAEKRNYPARFPWQDFDDMMNEMDRRFHDMLREFGYSGLFPAPRFRHRLIPLYRGTFTIDVKEHENEVIVVKEDIKITLFDPRTLNITFRREKRKEEKEEGYFLKERSLGRMKRIPANVTTDDSKATFNNGILELRLKKLQALPEKRIPVE
jgi:HSP20 family protein